MATSSIVQRIKSLFGLSKKSEVVGLRDAVPLSGGWNLFFPGLGGYTYSERNPIEYAVNAYGRNPHVFAVIDYIARKYAQLPRKFYETEQKEKPLEVIPTDLQQLQKLIDKPSWKQRQYQFLHTYCTQYLIHGNSIVFGIVPTGFSQIEEMYVALCQDVTINGNHRKPILPPTGYTINEVGTIDFDDILHVRMPNSINNDYWGLSPLYSGQAVYTASNNNLQAQASIHGNRGAIGVLSPKDSEGVILDQDQKALQDAWQHRNAGADKSGKVHVTKTAMTFTQIGMSPSDMKLIEHDTEALRTIGRIYGLNVSILNDTKSSTYNNLTRAEIAFYDNVLLPIAANLDKELFEWMKTATGVVGEYGWGIDTRAVKILNKPDMDVSKKRVEEVKANILPPLEALALEYPEIADRLNQERLTQLEANPAAANTNAEAQANLRGSVGGVQGILNIQQSVIQGATTYDSALAILREIYGFEEAAARSILGPQN